MAIKRIYLDQRDWITLARQHYGRTQNDHVAGVLALVREASSNGFASFPLSAAHYIETYHRRNPGQRQRLGAFMAEISKFHTIASAPDLLPAEVHTLICSTAGIAASRQPTPFGRGVRHAFNVPEWKYFNDPEVEGRVIAQIGQEQLFNHFETALLVGPNDSLPTANVALPAREFAERQLAFERETAQNLLEWGHNSDRAHRLVLAQEATDIVDLINSTAEEVGVEVRSILKDQQSLTTFILSLPAKGTVCRLRMSGHEDRNFRWHIGDLNDITALGTAAAYCDVVVAEKHWGSILLRHADDLRAQVTSDLRDLPALLVS